MPEQGFVKLPVVLAVVLGLGFVASGYLNYYQHQQANQQQTLMQGQITDLTYQEKQDRLATAGGQTASATTPAPTLSASPSPSPGATPAVAGTATIPISQFGVHFTVSDPIADLTYAPMESGGLIVAGLTTQSLVAKYPACKPGSALGMLVRRPSGEQPRAQDKLVKAIGGYNFYYVAPFGYCASDLAGRNTIAADQAAVVNSALPTLTN